MKDKAACLGLVVCRKHPAVLCTAAQEANATTLDLGIISDAAGVEGLERGLDAAIADGADVLLTSGDPLLNIHNVMNIHTSGPSGEYAHRTIKLHCVTRHKSLF